MQGLQGMRTGQSGAVSQDIRKTTLVKCLLMKGCHVKVVRTVLTNCIYNPADKSLVGF